MCFSVCVSMCVSVRVSMCVSMCVSVYVSVSEMPVENEDRVEEADEKAVCLKSALIDFWGQVRVDVFDARKVKISSYGVVNLGKMQFTCL